MLINLFLTNLVRISGLSSVFSAIAVLLYSPTNVLKTLRPLGKESKTQKSSLISKEEVSKECEFFGPVLGGEFLEGEFFGASFAVFFFREKKKQDQRIRPRNSGPEFGLPKFVSPNSAPNSGCGGAKSPSLR